MKLKKCTLTKDNKVSHGIREGVFGGVTSLWCYYMLQGSFNIQIVNAKIYLTMSLLPSPRCWWWGPAQWLPGGRHVGPRHCKPGWLPRSCPHPTWYIPALVSMVTAIDSYSCIGLAMWDYLCYDSRVRAYENKPQIICKLYSAVVRFEWKYFLLHPYLAIH